MNAPLTFLCDRSLIETKPLNKSPIGNLLACLLMVVCFCIPTKASAQSISLSEKNANLETIFKSITKQSGYVFFYNYRLLEQSKPVTIELKQASLKDALDACFQNQPFTYTIQGKQITVVLKQIQKTGPVSTPEILVSGTVRDSLGTVLPGITINIKGTTTGAISDQNGKFKLQAPLGSVVIFSSISYRSREVFINGKNTDMVVILGFKQIKLADVSVVSTGYQILQRSDIAGAVSSIKASELYFDGTTTLEQALQGKLPGVVITNQSGQVGTRQKTRVRGTSTLLGNQDPIWVVDGVIQEDPLPFKATTLTTTFGAAGNATKDNFDYIRDFVGNSISWLSPSDIDEISVLKDASATAIYGVRAANGVIVITTKKGKAGPPSINYSVSFNTSESVNYDRLNLMNSQERISVSKEIFERGLVGSANVNVSIGFAGALNDYLFKRTTYDQFNAQVKYLETVNTDWFKILFRTPLSVNQNIGMSGGNANTRYYASFGYDTNNGTAIGNDLTGYTGGFNLTSQLNDKLNISASFSASNRITNGFYQIDPYTYASKTSRVIPGYDPLGNPFFYANSTGYLFNIINELNNTGNSNKSLSARTNVNVNYKIIQGLTFQSLYSLSSTSTTGNTYATENTNYIAANIRKYDYGTAKPTDAAYLNSQLPNGGEYNEDDNQNLAWNWRNSLSYAKVFRQKHALTVLVGEELNSSHYTGFSSTTYGYLRDRGLAFATVPVLIGATSTKFANGLLAGTGSYYPKYIKTDRTINNLGVYGTVSYAYDNRYVVNFSLRNDRSNRFGQFTEEKFNPVVAGGLRWNIAREKWFDRTSWLSDLSLRGSLGFQRNAVSNVSPDLIAKIPTSPAATVIDQNTGDYLLTISSLPYADLRFEKTLSINLGLDYSLFQNKVNGTVEYYEKRSRDLVTFLPTPEEYGVLTMPINGGSMNNRGLEVSAGFVPIRTKNFTWSLSVNTSKNFSDLINTGTQQNLTWRTAAAGLLYKPGYPVSGLWAFDFTGVNPANGYPTINLTTAPGAPITTDPTTYMKYVGKADPDFTGGIGMNFRYKKLFLTSNFYLQLGGKKFIAPAYSLTNGVPSEFDNLSRQILDRWTPTNTGSNTPGLPDQSVGNAVLLPDGKTYTNVYEMYNYSTARVVSASSLRCNYVSLSYSLDGRIATLLHCKKISAGLGVSNPFAIVSKDFNGIDPEVATGGQPRVRSYSLNLNVSF